MARPSSSIAAEHQIAIVAGSIERSSEDVFNVAIGVAPDGFAGRYRKTHLPHLGVDHYATPGDEPYAVIDIGRLKIGMLICYNASFPEASRSLALLGADIIVLPTNWPTGADYVTNARASENKTYFIAVNRAAWNMGFSLSERVRSVMCMGTRLHSPITNGNRSSTLILTLKKHAKSKYSARPDIGLTDWPIVDLTSMAS